MTNQSNFERDRISREELRHLATVKKEKQTEFYHAIAKISYTALVVGIIVTCAQDINKIGWQHLLVLIFGLILTSFAYLHGNNKLK